jgi:hypothetical protein
MGNTNRTNRRLRSKQNQTVGRAIALYQTFHQPLRASVCVNRWRCPCRCISLPVVAAVDQKAILARLRTLRGQGHAGCEAKRAMRRTEDDVKHLALTFGWRPRRHHGQPACWRQQLSHQECARQQFALTDFSVQAACGRLFPLGPSAMHQQVNLARQVVLAPF